MAACGSLKHIFDNLLPESPTLIDSLSWNQLKPIKTLKQSPSFTEIFGELHFNESPVSSSSPSSSSSSFQVSSSSPAKINNTKLNQNEDSGSYDTNQTQSSATVSSAPTTIHINGHKSNDRFSSLNCESLQLCTEGLGCESSDEVEDMKSGMSECWETQSEIEKEGTKKQLHAADFHGHGECRRSRASGVEYPPPISCIGRNGKPWVCFKSYRGNGRFVLKEIRIPTQEFLHAYREDGRLKLQFVPSDDELLDEEEEEEEVEEEHDDDDEKEEEVESIDEEEENMVKENDDSVKVHAN